MKKLNFYTFLLLLLSITAINAQTFEWAKHIGGAGYDQGFEIITDKNDNVYSVGRFAGTIDFDPGPGTFNLTAAPGGYVSKLDKNGNFIWAIATASVQEFFVDDTGNVYITGSFLNTVDFDPGPGTFNLTSNGVGDAYVSKLDSNGNFLWAKQFGGTDNLRAWSISVDKLGYVYSIGDFKGTADFDPGTGTSNLTSTGSDYDSYISKLNPNGDFVWVKRIGGSGDQLAYHIALDSSSNIYTSGTFDSNTDFDPGSGASYMNASGTFDAFIQKLDSSGSFIWAKKIGGVSSASIIDHEIDVNGSIYFTGLLNGTIDFDPGPGTHNLTGSLDSYIAKFDKDGIFLWVKRLAGSTHMNSICLDTKDGVYSTGYFYNTVDFDPGPGVFNMTAPYNIFLSKLDTNGNFSWAKEMGGAANTSDIGHSVLVNYRGDIYSTGKFRDTANFDFGIGNVNFGANGLDDIYIHKISQCVNTTSTDVQTACGSFTWIDNNTYTSSNNTATHTLAGGNANGCDSIITLNLTINQATNGTDTQVACDSFTWIDNITYTSSNTTATHTLAGGNMFGCDSIVTLNLTINTVDTTVIVNGNTLNANAFGATYRWLDCNNNMAVIPGETNQGFNPTNNGSYALEITQNGCTDTSACHNIVLTGIGELNKSNISIYPNPTTNLITIKLNNLLENLSVELISIDGKIVQQQKVNNARKFTLDLSNENNGIYFLKLNSEKSTNQFKIIKQ